MDERLYISKLKLFEPKENIFLNMREQNILGMVYERIRIMFRLEYLCAYVICLAF